MLDAVTGVLVAVSGGPDSVALLDMLLRLAPGVRGWGSGQRGGGAEDLGSTEAPLPLCPSAPPRFSSPQPPSPIPHLHIAHLDHMLRGRESAEDAEFVRALADGLGLQVTIISADVRAAAKAAGRGIEETAREIRYDFLLSVANEIGCDRIAVGHTMTDQAETFVMRLIRGAGSRGLAAMRAVSPAHTFSSEGAEVRRGGGAEGQRGGGAEVQRRGGAPLPLGSSTPLHLCPSAPLLIRPLLCVTREEVEAYCRERNLEFRTDVTNQDSRYTRNRIRSEIIPAMTAINPRVVESIARAAENLASDQDALDSLSRSLLDNARVECPDNPDGRSDGSAAYSVTALLEQPPGLRRRMIIEALRLARGAAGDDLAAGEVSSTHVRAVEALLRPAASGKRITLPGGLEVWREFDDLLLKESGVEPENYQIAISASDTGVQAAGFGFTLERDLPGALLKSVIETTQRERARIGLDRIGLDRIGLDRIGLDWMAVALTDSALPECLIIRPRQSGERAHVVGQRRTKKLKNLMIDHRIPSSRRANWPLVTTPDGRYVWSPGLPPALEFAARDESQHLAILRASAI